MKNRLWKAKNSFPEGRETETVVAVKERKNALYYGQDLLSFDVNWESKPSDYGLKTNTFSLVLMGLIIEFPANEEALKNFKVKREQSTPKKLVLVCENNRQLDK